MGRGQSRPPKLKLALRTIFLAPALLTSLAIIAKIKSRRSFFSANL